MNIENQSQVIGHFYQAIPFYDGKVMKYQGMATMRNLNWMLEKEGMVMLTKYHGDRIMTDTHEEFTGVYL